MIVIRFRVCIIILFSFEMHLETALERIARLQDGSLSKYIGHENISCLWFSLVSRLAGLATKLRIRVLIPTCAVEV